MTRSHPDLSFNSHLFLISLFFFFIFLEPGQERRLEFLLEPVSVTKVLGATALLPCVLAGFPAPHVRWTLGDKLVEERYEWMMNRPERESSGLLLPSPFHVFTNGPTT